MNSYKISKDLTIYDALVHIESNRHRSLIVMDGEKVCGTLSDGDIRRAIINRVLLDVKIKNIMNLDFQFVGKSATDHEIKDRLKDSDIFILPQIDENKKLIKIHL
tara:strand:- start:2768 stop:3082 length:315 start_codon:yes stop_codon:yes gene_type:complete